MSILDDIKYIYSGWTKLNDIMFIGLKTDDRPIHLHDVVQLILKHINDLPTLQACTCVSKDVLHFLRSNDFWRHRYSNVSRDNDELQSNSHTIIELGPTLSINVKDILNTNADSATVIVVPTFNISKTFMMQMAFIRVEDILNGQNSIYMDCTEQELTAFNIFSNQDPLGSKLQSEYTNRIKYVITVERDELIVDSFNSGRLATYKDVPRAKLLIKLVSFFISRPNKTIFINHSNKITVAQLIYGDKSIDKLKNITIIIDDGDKLKNITVINKNASLSC